MKLSTKKLVMAAMFACMSFVLNTFVFFPTMAPFQHFINVIAAVILGPWYAGMAAFVCGILRMMSGRTIQAVVGAVFGPLLGGWLYKKFHNLWLAVLGEIIGTGIIGAIAVYPLMVWFYGLKGVAWYYYVPFYIPSAVVGALMGAAVILTLKHSGFLKRIMEEMNN